MTAQVDTDSDRTTDVLESLDFDIPCDVQDGPEHGATAYLTLSCGHGWFTCDAHATEAKVLLEKARTIAFLTNTHVMDCSVCNAKDPLVASILPIKGDDAS